MKIVYFGSDVFMPCFDYLADNHEVLALYTYHNDEDYFTEHNIVRKAENLGIPVHYESIDRKTIQEYLDMGCELFIAAEYDRIIDVPDDPDFPAINIHSSLLPDGRSYYPIEAAMGMELKETGVTIHKMTKNVDNGDIIAQKRLRIVPEMDSVDIYMKNSKNALYLLKDVLADFPKAWREAVPQGEKTPYWKRPATELLTLNHDMTREEARQVFRKFNSMTEVILGGGKYFVRAIMGGEEKLVRSELYIFDDLWLYAVKNGHLRLTVCRKKQKNRK